MPKKSFTVGGSTSESVSFDLVGTDTNGNPIQPIEFLCIPELQGTVLTELFELAQEDQTAAGLALMTSLIKQAIIPEQVDLFDQITHSKEILVKMETLAEIGQFLLEAYTGNPTNGSSGSSTGSASTAPTSMAAYLSQPEPTLRPSPPSASATPPIQ